MEGFRLFKLAVQALVLPAIVASCEQRAKPEGTPRDVDQTPEARVDSAAPAIDSTARASLPPPLAPIRTDSGSFASPLELADLSAALAVPVQGVMPSQLRDTYAEPRAGHAHEALDIAAPRGTPVLSATDGRLLKLFNSIPGGLMVYAADASERFILLYGHLDRYADGLSDGMRLERGQVIGYVGTTGNAASEAPHLHFGILRGHPAVSWSRGVPVNPYPLLVAAELSR